MVLFHQPGFALKSYVQGIVYSNYHPDHQIDRLIPDGTVNLIIELGEFPQFIFDNNDLSKKKKYSGSWISGMQTEYISISAANKGMMVVQFQATGAYPILHVPIKELNNMVVDASLILGSSITELRDKLIDEPVVSRKIEYLEEWLSARILNQTLPESVVQYAVEQTLLNPTAMSIRDIKDKIGYSHKHFIQLFNKYVGLTPKQYQRIVRFNKTLASINQGMAINWARLSLDCGYYDQAHFIKEFKNFSGLNPRDYLSENVTYTNYIPIYL